jgi:hypothetical protein
MRRAVGMASAAEVFVALLKTPLARHFKASQRQKKKLVSAKVRQLIACARSPAMFSNLAIHFADHGRELNCQRTPLRQVGAAAISAHFACALTARGDQAVDAPHPQSFIFALGIIRGDL